MAVNVFLCYHCVSDRLLTLSRIHSATSTASVEIKSCESERRPFRSKVFLIRTLRTYVLE